jgi:hypothetical protein
MWEERKKEAVELIRKTLPVLQSVFRGDAPHMTKIVWPAGLLDEYNNYLAAHKK